MSSTKKMPFSLGKNGQPSNKSEFVIPHPQSPSEGGFYGVKTGKTHPQATITFIGRSINAEDIMKKIHHPIANPKELAIRVEEYLRFLQDFKIGNVISISYNTNNTFKLDLQAKRPGTTDRKSLP